MKKNKNQVCFVLALALALALLPGCHRKPAGIQTLDLAELAASEFRTDWTMDEVVRPAACFELAPDRPLGYARMAGFDGKNLLLSVGDSVLFAGPDGKIVSAFSHKGNGPQEYLRNEPYFDPEGRVLVLDLMKRRALTYLQDGTFVSALEDLDYVDIHFFPDGSRVVMARPDFAKETSRTFSVLGPDGKVRSSGPERSSREMFMAVKPGLFTAAADGSCWLIYAEQDTLYRIRPEGAEAVAAFVRPTKSTGGEQQSTDGSFFLQQDLSRFMDRNCLVLGDLMYYSFNDREQHVEHYLVLDLRNGACLYHGLVAPLLHLDAQAVHVWPVYANGRDAWCQLPRKAATVMLPDYDDDSNDAFVHLVSR